ncbi:hypothetical protein JOD82_001932 [Paenibacillus sp. 1182]|uniref:hypothetical protein n=1 Tax=Paenibacillus sp. 1182 TaxID=2806565 RepID=UPI001AE207C7|nr:hypothetical protein [Paenibacillus sp. 1182]MBP1308912.1 hypothetical protein [Paenibacillus sp. 1182]
MINEMNRFLEIVKEVSPKSFINEKNELIIVPKNNIYFRLDDMQSDLDLKCRVIAWLSRPSCKGISPYWQKRMLAIVNTHLRTNFTKDQMSIIYTYLGNDCNRKLCINFIESGYDLSLLKR